MSNNPEVDPLEEITVTVDDLDGVMVIPAGSEANAETINVSDLAGAQAIDLKLKAKKASDAFLIAVIIVGTFSAVILITLLIALGILWKTGDPNRVKTFADAVTPIYESLGKFVPPVFGSLLAFILGYYYSKEQQK
jgi:hypothetical protein